MIVSVDETLLLTAGEIHSISWRDSHKAICTPEFLALHTPSHQAEYLRHGMAEGKRVFMLIDEGSPVGIVAVQGSLIEDLYVLPDRQRRGYGTALLRHAEGMCEGAPTLWILENNLGAKALYERLGYVLTGRWNAVTSALREIEMART